jgi:hypothetical protein
VGVGMGVGVGVGVGVSVLLRVCMWCVREWVRVCMQLHTRTYTHTQ